MNQNAAEGAIMGNKEEIKANILEEVVREKNASAGHMTGAKDLLSAMGAASNQDATPETKKPCKIPWQQILVACCCILAITAAGIGFLYLDTKISAVQSAVGAVVKDLNTLKSQVITTDTKEQLAAVTAEVEHLKATNTRLQTEVKEIRDTLEALKARKNNVVPAQQKRR